MDQRTEVIERMRALSRRFIDGEIPFDEFYPALGQLVGYFDPYDRDIRDLPAALQAEVIFYEDWTGSEFSESPKPMPAAKDWVYGESTEPYGWIDRDAFRRLFAEDFRRLSESHPHRSDAT